jgi:hypothetical protein
MTPEEEQDEWLRQQAAQASVNQPAQQAPAAPGPWAKARELMQRQSAMQYKPQQYAEVKPEAAPDDSTTWRTILAMGLNLFGNKGRDVGDIMMQGAQMRNAQLADWQKRNSPDALLARQMQTKQLQNMDRQAFNDERKVLGDQVNQEVAMAGAEQSQANADRSFNRQEERDIAGDVQHQMDQERAAAQFAQTHALSQEQLRAANANAAASRAQALRFHKDAQAQHLADQEFNANESLNAQASAAARARAEREMELEKAGMAARAKAADQARLERNDLVSQSSNYSNDAREALAMLPQLKTAREIMSKYKGKDIPGLGKFDASFEPGSFSEQAYRLANGGEFTEDALKMRNALNRLATVDIKNISGAHVPDMERAALMLQAGAGKMDERAAAAAIDQLERATKMELKGRAANREQAARDVLRAYGMDNIFDPEAAAPPDEATILTNKYGLKLVQ